MDRLRAVGDPFRSEQHEAAAQTRGAREPAAAARVAPRVAPRHVRPARRRLRRRHARQATRGAGAAGRRQAPRGQRGEVADAAFQSQDRRRLGVQVASQEPQRALQIAPTQAL